MSLKTVPEQIKELTKAELIELYMHHGFFLKITEKDIKWVKWTLMTRKAKRMAAEACAAMKKYTGPENWPAYSKAAAKFDRAMALYKESDKYLNHQPRKT